MPQRSVRAEHWSVGEPVSLGAVSLLIVERAVRTNRCGHGRGWIWVTREPAALVVCDDAAPPRAVGIGGPAVGLEQLLERVPDLAAALASTPSAVRRNEASGADARGPHR